MDKFFPVKAVILFFSNLEPRRLSGGFAKMWLVVIFDFLSKIWPLLKLVPSLTLMEGTLQNLKFFQMRWKGNFFPVKTEMFLFSNLKPRRPLATFLFSKRSRSGDFSIYPHSKNFLRRGFVPRSPL